jgi:hypothetical protein
MQRGAASPQERTTVKEGTAEGAATAPEGAAGASAGAREMENARAVSEARMPEA